MFGYLLHAHLLGVKIRVDWFRNGKPNGVLAQDNNYDFNFQENRVFTDVIKLMPVSKQIIFYFTLININCKP